MKVLGVTSAKNAKLRGSKRNSSGKVLRSKTKAKKKTRSARFGESSGLNNEVNRNSSHLKRLSTRNQRKKLLKPKRLKQVRINKRKSILSKIDSNKLHKEKMMQVDTGCNSTETFVPYESTDMENDSETDECIFVDNKEKGGVIVIDDDDDDDINGTRPTTKGNIRVEDVILIDSQTSINSSDFQESKPNTPTRSSQNSNSTSGTSPQIQRDIKPLSYSLKALLPSEVAENDLFYKDTTPGLDTSSLPLYIVDPPDDSVILVDSMSESVQKQSIAENVDDSVIFVGEEILLHDNHHSQQAALNYIPLLNDNNQFGVTPLKRKSSTVIDKVIQPFKKFKNHLSSLCQSTSTPKNKHDLLTLTEQKKNQLYNSNVYNPSKEIQKTGKRMVIIDGSNVAFGHSLNKEFSVKGLEFCIEYFIKKGHEVKAVVPQFRLQKNKSSNPERLEELHKEGRIVFTPCKNLPGKSTTSYDDRFILQLAVEFDAAVVSNDNYRDLLNENPAFKKIIENRVIGYTWCKDMFLLPKDPYGRLGPTLSVILNH